MISIRSIPPPGIPLIKEADAFSNRSESSRAPNCQAFLYEQSSMIVMPWIRLDHTIDIWAAPLSVYYLTEKNDIPIGRTRRSIACRPLLSDPTSIVTILPSVEPSRNHRHIPPSLRPSDRASFGQQFLGFNRNARTDLWYVNLMASRSFGNIPTRTYRRSIQSILVSMPLITWFKGHITYHDS